MWIYLCQRCLREWCLRLRVPSLLSSSVSSSMTSASTWPVARDTISPAQAHARRQKWAMSYHGRCFLCSLISINYPPDRLSSRFLVLINKGSYVHPRAAPVILRSSPVQTQQKSNMPRPASLPWKPSDKSKNARPDGRSPLLFPPRVQKRNTPKKRRKKTKLENARPICCMHARLCHATTPLALLLKTG